MIFDLVKDFADVLDAMPEGHPRRRILSGIEETLRLDKFFIAKHPTTTFQCLWNRCWWSDCQELEHHVPTPASGQQRAREDEARLSNLLEQWRRQKARQTPGFRWLRSLLPPASMIGSAIEWEVRTSEVADMRLGSPQIAANGDRILLLSQGQESTLDQKRVLTILDAKSGDVIGPPELGGPIHDAVASPSGSFAICALKGQPSYATGNYVEQTSSGHSLAWIDLQSGSLRQTFGRDYAYLKLALSPDGRQLAALTFDRKPQSVDVWDLNDLCLTSSFDQPRAVTSVSQFCWNQVGIRLVEWGNIPGAGKRFYRIIDPRNRRELCPADDFRAGFAISGNVIREVLVRIVAWTYAMLSGKRPVGDVLAMAGEPATPPLVSPVGDDVAVAYNGGFVQLWSVRGRKRRRLVPADQGRFPNLGYRYCIAFSPDGTRLVAARINEGEVDAWDMTHHRYVGRTQLAADRPFTDMAICPDNRRLVGVAPQLGAVQLNSLSDKATDGLRWPSLLGEPAVSNDGKSVAACFRDESIRIWESGTGRQLRAWSLSTGEELDPLQPGPTTLNSYAGGSAVFIPNSDLLVAISSFNKGCAAWLFSLESGDARLLTFDDAFPQDTIPTLRPSPTGSCLAVSAGGTTILWSVATRRVEHRLDGYPVSEPFSPDGAFIATTNGDLFVVHLWDASSGGQLHTWTLEHRKHEQLEQLCFTDDKRVVLITNRMLRYMDMRNGKEVTRTKRPSANVIWSKCRWRHGGAGFVAPRYGTHFAVFCDRDGKERRELPGRTDLDRLANPERQATVLTLDDLHESRVVESSQLQTVAVFRDRVNGVASLNGQDAWCGTDGSGKRFVLFRLESDFADHS